MRLNHHPRPTLKTTARSRQEGGYVMALFGLLLVPLLLMAGLAVDIGSWYNEASNIQKAADAASLAGVVWLPDEVKAKQVALDVAKMNGYDDADPYITVTVAPSTKSDHRLQVAIRDTRVGSYFYSNLGGNNITLNRDSFAEYVLPVKMGSPLNNLGNDPTATGYPTGAPNLWASISGYATAYANGDPYSTAAGSNAEYRDWGYLYVVDIPPAAVGKTLNLSIYDAGNYARSSYPNVETADNGTVNTQFEFFRPDDTPLNARDGLIPVNSMSGQCTSGTPGRFRLANGADSTTYKNKWVSLCTVTADEPGQWIMQVKSSAIPTITNGGDGWNQFSVRAVMTGTVQPALYTIGDLSLFNNLPGQTGNINASFYLAQIDPIHAGKTLEVSLFDPGDGLSGDYYANIRAPGNVVSTCKYRPRGTSTWTTSATCRIQTRANGTNTYNGKWLDIQLPLSTSYTCSTDCWWKVLYEFQGVTSGNSPNDRTVWSAQVIGDPVHLIEEN
ncbi:hypothetical protein BH10ACT1_BH10ACT1_20240 [soil metagenome]